MAMPHSLERDDGEDEDNLDSDHEQVNEVRSLDNILSGTSPFTSSASDDSLATTWKWGRTEEDGKVLMFEGLGRQNLCWDFCTKNLIVAPSPTASVRPQQRPTTSTSSDRNNGLGSKLSWNGRCSCPALNSFPIGGPDLRRPLRGVDGRPRTPCQSSRRLENKPRDTFRILQNTLKGLIAENFVERTNIRILNMVEAENLSSDVVVHGNKRDDKISSLYEFNIRSDTTDRKNTGLTAIW
jgi:hypothetical protein